ncbi:hypothetical protein [Halomicrococcus gelatinilyticus]|uniref:hypothetical protein n=1 Tax=Halomicrococcus gelatinilyticus TaxID=1702103 RepID=UPI002E0FFC82
MLERLLSVFGLVELVAPDWLVERSAAAAFESTDGCTLKSWVRPAIRVEGAAFVLLGLRGRSPTFRRLLGLLGVPAAVAPRRFVAFGTRLAHDDAEACQWRSWVVPATRVLGLAYVLVALREVGGRSSETER